MKRKLLASVVMVLIQTAISGVVLVTLIGCTTQNRDSAESERPQPLLADGRIVTVGANWEVGESRDYVATRSKALLQAGEVVDESSVEGPVTVSVQRSAGKRYLMRWTSGIDWIAIEQLGLSSDSGEIEAMPVPLEYLVSGAGEFMGVSNGQELRVVVGRVFEGLLQDPAMTPAQRASFNSFIDRYMLSMNDEALFGSQPILFHSLHGGEYEIGGTYSWEQDLPSQLGGSPITTYSDYSIAAGSRENTIRVVEEQTFEMDDMLALAQAMIGDLGLDDSSLSEDGLSEDAYDIRQRFVWVVDFVTGWPLLLERTNTVRHGDSEYTKAWTLELTE